MKRNVTLTVDEDLLRAARGVALDRRTSVNSLVRDHLAELVDRKNLGSRDPRVEPPVSETEAPWLGTILQMRGLGASLWKNEDPDEYVRVLRENWPDNHGQ